MMRRIAVMLVCLLAPLSASASITLGHANTNALSNGLVGYWSFDGSTIDWKTNTFKDLSGQGNNAASSTMSTTTDPTVGKIGQALNFRALHYIDADSIATPLQVSDVTETAWVYLPKGFQVGDNVMTISHMGDGPSNNDIFFSFGADVGAVGEGRLHFDYADGGGGITEASSSKTSWAPGWYFVAGTYASSTSVLALKVYINGVVDGPGITKGAGRTLGGFSTHFRIGDMMSAVPDLPFVGKIDELRVYNRALSAQEIALAYAVGMMNTGHATAPTNSSAPSLSKGLITYWPLDGSTINWTKNTITDLSGSGNTGTTPFGMSTTTSSVIGKIGSALYFNGAPAIGQYIVGTNTVNIPLVSEAVWVKIKSSPGAYGELAGFIDGLGTTQHDKELQVNPNGTVSWYVFDGNPKNSTSTQIITDNKWHHLVGVADGTNSILYIDGVRATSTLAGNTFTSYSATGNIFLNGASTGSNGAQFTPATEDDFRVYNRALSAQEVQQLYALGTVNVAHSNATAISSSLVGYWPLDGSTINWTTNTFRDISGNANNATSTGMSTSTSPVIGKIGGALKFNGVGSGTRLNLGTSNALTPSRFTIAAWVYKNVDTCYNYIYSNSRDVAGPYNGINFYIYCGADLNGDIWNGGTAFTITSSALIPNNKWTHVAFSYDGAKMYLYINGRLDNSQAQTTDPGTPASFSTVIGGLGQDPTLDMNGKIDDVRLYSRALSPQEINQLYLLGR